jgi:IS6 family transposase
VYRAIDQFGQVIDVFVSPRRDLRAARRFRQAIGATKVTPAEVTTDQAPVYPGVLEPMRGLKQDRSAKVIITGHVLVQNVRRGHDELAVDEPAGWRLAIAFDELAVKI